MGRGLKAAPEGQREAPDGRTQDRRRFGPWTAYADRGNERQDGRPRQGAGAAPAEEGPEPMVQLLATFPRAPETTARRRQSRASRPNQPEPASAGPPGLAGPPLHSLPLRPSRGFPPPKTPVGPIRPNSLDY
jgi:hypothetical protein